MGGDGHLTNYTEVKHFISKNQKFKKIKYNGLLFQMKLICDEIGIKWFAG